MVHRIQGVSLVNTAISTKRTKCKLIIKKRKKKKNLVKYEHLVIYMSRC